MKMFRTALIALSLFSLGGCTCNKAPEKSKRQFNKRIKKVRHLDKKLGAYRKKKGKGAIQRVPVKLYFVDVNKIQAGDEDIWVEVERMVGSRTPAKNAIWQLYKGPTPEEAARGLSLYRSGSEGFTGFHVDGDTATLSLRGGCTSGGSTTTVYNHISKTLKAFPRIEHVRLLAPEQSADTIPAAAKDFRPDCLEP